MSRVRRISRGFAIALGAVLLVVLLALAALQTPPAKAKIASFVSDTVSESINGTFEVGEVEGIVLGSATVVDVVVRDPRGNVVAHVPEAEASFGLLDLLRSTVSVDHVEVRSPVVIVRTYPDGTLNVASLATDASETESPTWRIDVADVALKDATIVYYDATVDDRADVGDALDAVEGPESALRVAGLVRSGDGAPIDAAPGLATVTGLDARAEMTMLTSGESTYRVRDLAGALGVDRVSSEMLFTAGELRAHVTGSSFGAVVGNLDVEERVAVGRVAARLGFVSGEADAGQAFESVYVATEKVRVEPALLRRIPRVFSEDAIVVDARAGGDPSSEITFSLEAHVDAKQRGTLRTYGTVTEPDSPARLGYDVVVATRGLALSDVVELPVDVAPLNVEFSITGKGVDPETLSARGRARIRNSQVDAYWIEDVYLDLTARDGTLRLRSLDAVTPYATGRAAGSFGLDGAFDFEARVDSAEGGVRELGKRVLKKTFGDTQVDADVEVKGKLNLDADEPLALVENLDVDASWRLRDFSAEDVVVASSRGDVLARVDTLADGGRAIVYDVRASGRRLRVKEYRLRSFSVDASGRAVHPPLSPRGGTFLAGEPAQGALDALLGRLRTDASARVDGFESPGARVSTATAKLKLVPTSPKTTEYELEADVSGAEFDGATIDAASTELSGSYTVRDGKGVVSRLERVSARGSASARGVSSGGRKVASAELSVDVRGPPRDLVGGATLEASSVDAAGYRFERLDTTLRLEGDRAFAVDVDATQVDGEPENLRLTARGKYSRDLTDYTVESVEFHSLDQGWSVSDGFGVDTKRGRFEFDDVTLRQGDQTVHVQGYVEKGKGQDLTVGARDVDIAQIRRQFGIDEMPDVRGTVSAKATVDGTWKRPSATFELVIEDLYYRGYGPFGLSVRGRYRNAELQLDSVAATAYGTTVLDGFARAPIDVDMDGNFSVRWDEPLQVTAEIPPIGMETLHEAVDVMKEYSVVGTLSGDLDVRGTVDDPRVDFDVELDGLHGTHPTIDDVVYGPVGLEMFTQYRADTHSEGGVDVGLLAAFGAEKPSLRLDAHTPAPVDDWVRDVVQGEDVDFEKRLMASAYELDVVATKFDLRNVRLASMRKADVTGTVDLRLKGSGTFAEPNGSLDLDLRGFGWHRFRDIVLETEATLADAQLHLKNLRLEWDADDILRAQGRLPVPADVVFGDAKLVDLPVDFSVELLTLPIKKFSAVDYTFAAIKGTIGGFVEATGTLSDPHVRGRFSAVDMEFSDRSRGTLAFSFDAKQDVVDSEVMFCHGTESVAYAHAAVPVTLDTVALSRGDEFLRDGPIDGAIKIDGLRMGGLVPNKIFDEYVTDVEGALAADLKLTGSVDDPALDGFVQLADARFYLPSLGRQFSDVEAAIDVTPEKLAIEKLAFRDGQGSLMAEGTIGYSDFRPTQTDVVVRADRFGTAGATDFPMFVTGSLDVDGDLSGEAASAKAVVSELEVNIPSLGDEGTYPLELDSDVVVIEKQRTTDIGQYLDFREQDTSQELEAVYANLSIVIERDSWVRHPYGSVEIAGAVEATVSSAGANLAGEVRAVRGDFKMLGKRFDIGEGIVQFTGSNPPNPRIQVVATHPWPSAVVDGIGQASSGKARAIVRATGTAQNPTIRFTSDPPLPESDVIYALLTNRPPGEAGVGQGGSPGGLAAGAASGLASGVVQSKVAQYSPVEFDVVRVEAGEGGFADPRFEVGKYVLPNVFLSIEYEPRAEDDENTAEVNLELRISRRWLFEIEAGRARSEASLMWDIY